MREKKAQAGGDSIHAGSTGWKSFLLPAALAVCLFAAILVSGLGLVARAAQSAHAGVRQQLRVSAETVDIKMEGLYASIEAVAPLMAYEAGYTKEQMLTAMNALLDAHSLDFVVRTDPDGIAMNHLGKENIDLTQRAYVREALAGARAIALVASGAYDPQSAYIILAVPILHDGKVVGVLHGSYKTANFVTLLTGLTGEYGQGCDEISIVASDGTVVASSNPSFDAETLGELARRAAAAEETAAEDFDMQEIEANGRKRYYYFDHIEAGTQNGWYMAARMSQDYLLKQTAFARYSAMALMSVAILITVALLYIVFSRQKLSNALRKRSELLTEALDSAKKADVAKSQFLSRMSHEIRTPLNAVIGYNTVARNEMTEAQTDEERRQASMKVMDCLTKSDIASKHLLTIINDVLDMSAIESGKIRVVNERFDFKGLITSLTAVFYSQAKAKGVELDVLFDSDMDEWVIGDQMRVNQILTNLLSNAVKFTPDGGRVTLTIRPEKAEGKIRVRFTVADTGIGMTEETMRRLWTPFEQADSSISRRFGGTGLGLSITKTLVGLMGGAITAESAPGKGSTFTVELAFAETEQPQQHGLYDFSDMNVLIVDDDAGTCDYIRLLLTRNGVRSAAVTSGADALAAIASASEEGAPYTVCLVDWRMPRMDGMETIRRIRKIAGKDLPIIVITAYDFSEVAGKVAGLGIHTFLSKPLFQSSLFDLLANICGRRVPENVEKLAAYDFSGARVLLAEDNAMNMEIARRILETAGLAVDSAWNGLEAAEKFENAPAGAYAAILMDVQMPVMDGYAATRKIRGLSRADAATIPIVAMTADAFAENVAESLAAGMNAHISKPIDVEVLFKTLRKYL